MELWQLDVIGGIALEGGRYLKVVTGVDDHSRFCVLATVVVSETARAVAGAFAGALRRYGVPDEVLTDNGSAFTGRRRVRPGEVLFERICRENGWFGWCLLRRGVSRRIKTRRRVMAGSALMGVSVQTVNDKTSISRQALGKTAQIPGYARLRKEKLATAIAEKPSPYSAFSVTNKKG